MADKRSIAGGDGPAGEPRPSKGKAGRVAKRVFKNVTRLTIRGMTFRLSENVEGLQPTERSASMHGRRVVIERAASERVIADPEQTIVRTSSERSAIIDFEAEADRLGIPLGAAPTDDEAHLRLGVVAADASDLFATPAVAMDYLTTKPLDGKGRNGIQILREKGLPGVISGLDHLRFGSRE